MNPQKFETEVCEILKAMGFWALNIPRNRSGAQPFDVIAIRGSQVLAIDCKVCSKDSFPLSRVEDNQWTAFKVVSEKTDADIGIIAYYNGEVFFLSYDMLADCKKSTIKLTSSGSWLGKEDVKQLLGRYLE